MRDVWSVHTNRFGVQYGCPDGTGQVGHPPVGSGGSRQLTAPKAKRMHEFPALFSGEGYHEDTDCELDLRLMLPCF